MENPERIVIKGTSNGVIITIGAGDWQSILGQLATKLGQRSSFFKGGRVSLAVSKRLLEAKEIETVGHLLAEHHMTLWAVVSDSPETRAAAQSLGLEAEPVTSPPAPTIATVAAEQDALVETTITIRRTLRSGQSIEHPGSVVVIGDVNPGAKIVAGRNIIIWGRLRGSAHAGAVLADDAFVCALELSPMQLSIGNIISRAPAEAAPADIMPEMALVQNGQIVAEGWQ